MLLIESPTTQPTPSMIHTESSPSGPKAISAPYKSTTNTSIVTGFSRLRT